MGETLSLLMEVILRSPTWPHDILITWWVIFAVIWPRYYPCHLVLKCSHSNIIMPLKPWLWPVPIPVSLLLDSLDSENLELFLVVDMGFLLGLASLVMAWWDSGPNIDSGIVGRVSMSSRIIIWISIWMKDWVWIDWVGIWVGMYRDWNLRSMDWNKDLSIAKS